MPAIDFPSSPTNGQVFTDGASTWVYDSAKGAWRSAPYEPGAAITSATAPTNPQNGDIWFNTEDGTTYVYYNDGNSAQWTEIRSEIARSQVGLVPIVPTSVTLGSGTGSVSANGLVTFTGASSVSFNNVFSSTFANYKIMLSLSLSTGAQLTYMRMRSGTTDNTSTYVWGYIGQRITNSTTNWASSSSTTAGICILNSGASGPQTTSIDMLNPFVVGSVTTWNLVGYWADSVGASGFSGGGLHANAGSFDGFSIYPGGGSISGSIKVYGYN